MKIYYLKALAITICHALISVSTFADSGTSQALIATDYLSYKVGDSWGKVDLSNNEEFNRSIFRSNGTSTAVGMFDNKILFLTNFHLLNRQGFDWESFTSIQKNYDSHLMHRNQSRDYFQYIFQRDPEEICADSVLYLDIADKKNPLINYFENEYRRIIFQFNTDFKGYYKAYVEAVSKVPHFTKFANLSLYNQAHDDAKENALRGLSTARKSLFYSLIDKLDILKISKERFEIPLVCDKILWDALDLDLSIVSYQLETDSLTEYFEDFDLDTSILKEALKHFLRPKTLDFSSQFSQFSPLATAGFGPNQFKDDVLSGDMSDECLSLGSNDEFYITDYVHKDYEESFIYADFFSSRKKYPLGCDAGPGDSGSPIFNKKDTGKIIGILISMKLIPGEFRWDDIKETAQTNFDSLITKYQISFGSSLYQVDKRIKKDLQSHSLIDPDAKLLLKQLLEQSILSN